MTIQARKFTISNKDAKEALTKYKGLLSLWSNKNRNKLWNYEEVYAIGLEGLIKAADRFEDDKGSSIANYAAITMNTGLWDALDSHNYALQGRRQVFESEMPSVENDRAIQAKHDLNKVLKNLTDTQRDALVLRRIYGYTLKETGEFLQMTHQAVDEAERHALSKLRRIYAS